MPARDFIEGLSEGEQRKLTALFKKMAETGRISNQQQFKKVQGDIWEFKRYDIRIACFQIGRRWILTHGFIKKQNRWPPTEIERAKRIMDQHSARER